LSRPGGRPDGRRAQGDKVYSTIHSCASVRLSEAPSHGLPALVYDLLRCPGSQAYIKLAGELHQTATRQVAERAA
jgi:chromosome partitioning protein